jgi:transglutaminase-like putative cysteine protease
MVSTGVYSVPECAGMALPLLLAALAEWRSWSLARWHRVLEVFSLAAFLLMAVARIGLLPTVTNTLFILCGVRLSLPRQLPQRRQLLLMGFVLFLTTAITTSELDFLLWSLIWLGASAALLLQQTWERSALLRHGPLQGPPYRLVLAWTVAATLLASGFFVILPRLRLGFRNLPVGVQNANAVFAGLSDVLDLGGKGPIQPSREVALRILPAPGSDLPQERYASAMALLRGYSLEGLDGQRWQVAPGTPRRDRIRWTGVREGPRPLEADFFVGPTLRGLIPLPYGEADLTPAPGDTLRHGQGGAVRWQFPPRRITALRVALGPAGLEPERPPRGERLALLTDPGRDTSSALRWSLKVAPGELPPRILAETLSQALGGFRYTLDNPSGGAANPLADFLERSRAGHCEYFACALALMLRHRGVPARVVTGYRLGPWISEGGYFLVTQNEAHSWVEYYDPAGPGWRVSDPTPGAPPSTLVTGSFAAALARWTDAIRFRWDRHVVRFSDEDQLAGAEWLRDRFEALSRWRPGPGPRRLAKAAGALALLAALVWIGRRRLPAFPWPAPAGAGRIRALAPLLRASRRAIPPLAGETARTWLGRLAAQRPERAAALAELAREADAVAYGGRAPSALKALARAEARHWRSGR